MKAVMYHYVRTRCDKHPYFRFLDITNFRKQLDFFESNYGFVTKSEWAEFADGELAACHSNKVVLTFDDAVRCHYEFVFPELERRGLWGIFYVPSMPYSEGKILDLHRIHLLCGAFVGEKLNAALLSLINEEMLPNSKRGEFSIMTYLNQSNYDGVSQFKRVLNYFIDYRFRENLIDRIGSTLNYNFDSTGIYVPLEHLREMQQAGHIIGSHSVSHPVMSKLSREQQKKQIEDSFAFLDRIGRNESKTYCHPYGGFHSFIKDTVELLTEYGVKYYFNVEPRDIVSNDIIHFRQSLPRYDCNAFIHGKAS